MVASKTEGIYYSRVAGGACVYVSGWKAFKQFSPSCSYSILCYDFHNDYQRLRTKPHEYACIGCEQKVSDHETIFETRESRLRRGANIDHAYIPLSDNDYLTSQVIEGKGKLGGRARRPALGNNPRTGTSLPAIKNSPAVFNPDTAVARYR